MLLRSITYGRILNKIKHIFENDTFFRLIFIVSLHYYIYYSSNIHYVISIYYIYIIVTFSIFSKYFIPFLILQLLIVRFLINFTFVTYRFNVIYNFSAFHSVGVVPDIVAEE